MMWQRYLGTSLIRRIVIGLIVGLALGLVPVTLLLVKQELIARAGDTVALGAADIADKLDMVLAERLGDIQAFSRAPVLNQPDRERITAYLDHLKQLYPMYQRLSVVATDGRVLASTDRALQGTPLSSEAWFRAIAHNPQPYAEIVQQHHHAGGSLGSVRFATQFVGTTGTWQGAIMTEVHEQVFRTFVTQTTHRGNESSSQPEIAEFLVLSPTGDVLLTSDAHPAAPSDRNPVRLPSTVLADQGKTGYVEEVDTGSGINALTGFARMGGLPHEPEFQWRILVRADRSAVLHSIWILLWKLIGIGTVALLPLLGLLYRSWRQQLADETRAAIAHRAMEATNTRTRKIIDIALDAVITIDHQGVITGWNAQAEQIFGWTVEEALGQSLTDTIIPPSYREAHERGIRLHRETGQGPVLNQRIEVSARHRSGREFPVELAITPIHLDGQTEFSAFLRDITERKQTEEDLRRTRTAAESANRMKTEFLANMSHELRTPLNAIIGTSDLLLKSSLTPEQRECAVMGQRASQALLRLVDDLLDLAKIEAGTLRVESSPFDLTELLERTRRLVELRQRGKDVALHIDIAPEVPTLLEGDGFRLQQILLNLLGNALKFTEQGSVSLILSIAQADPRRPLLQFTVSDTGIGIPANQLDHIFGRFTQVDSGDSRKYGGAGLGLSICKQLVDMMGGTIQVTSETGKGSTFTVALPFSVTAALSGTPATSDRLELPDAAARNTPAKTQAAVPLTILLIDDSPETGQLVSLYLKDLPYQLDLAGSGPAALQQCQAHRYDLVFLDLQMPGMDGYATAEAIRAWEKAQGLPPMPILALTADVLNAAWERSLKAGCTGFIGKPFSQTAFLETISYYANLSTAPPDRKRPSPADSPPPLMDEQDLDRLREKFLHNRRLDLEILASAVRTSDWATIQTIGHRMKGLAGSYGFTEIGAIGTALEDAAHRRQLHRVAAEIHALTQILTPLDPAQDHAA
ncbi:MAG: ATP-binding protein [Nitrospira sp.]|jgi:PAS domain S-box-containing protein|nr:ATP-binding protein [Nitrospira sp.]